MTRSKAKAPRARRGASASARSGAPIPGCIGSGGRPSHLPVLPEVPGGPRHHGGMRRASRVVPLQGWGPHPRNRCSQGAQGYSVAWVRRLGEVVPDDGSCDCALGSGTSSWSCLDGSWPSRCAQSGATGWTPPTPGANSAQLGHHLLEPQHRGDPRP